MSLKSDIRDLIAKKEAMKVRIREELAARNNPQAQATQSPSLYTPPNVQPPLPPPQKKAGWGWALLIVGGGIAVFWGIPLLQGKGAFKPGMSKPQGYVPTRSSPSEE